MQVIVMPKDDSDFFIKKYYIELFSISLNYNYEFYVDNYRTTGTACCNPETD